METTQLSANWMQSFWTVTCMLFKIKYELNKFILNSYDIYWYEINIILYYIKLIN